MNLNIGPGDDLDPSLLPYEDPFEGDADLNAVLREVDSDLDDIEDDTRRRRLARRGAQLKFQRTATEVERATRNIARRSAQQAARSSAALAPTASLGFIPDLTSSAPVNDDAEGMLPIMSPLHNAREIAKQLTLLEDHLVHPSKRCHDCIRKHLLTAEGLAEEAVTLGADPDHHRIFGSAAAKIRGISRSFLQSDDRVGLQQEVRGLRKAMGKLGFDSVLLGQKPRKGSRSEGKSLDTELKRVSDQMMAVAKTRGWSSEVTTAGQVAINNAYQATTKWASSLSQLLSDEEDSIKHFYEELVPLWDSYPFHGTLPGWEGLAATWASAGGLSRTARAKPVTVVQPSGILAQPVLPSASPTVAAPAAGVSGPLPPLPIGAGVAIRGGDGAWARGVIDGAVDSSGQVPVRVGGSVVPYPAQVFNPALSRPGASLLAPAIVLASSPVSAQLRGRDVPLFGANGRSSIRLTEAQLLMADIIQSVFEGAFSTFPAGVPTRLAQAAVVNALYESRLNPLAAVTQGRDDSWGLFQCNRLGGLGAGWSPEELQNPIINARIIAAAVSGVSQRRIEPLLRSSPLAPASAWVRWMTTEVIRPADPAVAAERRAATADVIAASVSDSPGLVPAPGAVIDSFKASISSITPTEVGLGIAAVAAISLGVMALRNRS